MTLMLEQSSSDPPSWVPRDYQERAVGLAISQACLGLLLSPGRGKTTIIYCALSILLSKRLIKKTLVIAPLRVCYNVWPVQCKSWAEFAHLRVTIVHGKDKEKNLYDPNYDIYCINPEGLAWLCDDPKRLAHLRANFDVLVVDESVKFKNTGTQRFKLLRKFVKNFKRRYILTGTFTPNGLLDLFGQIFILDEGASLGQWITHYRTKYFYATDYLGYDLAPHPWASEEIARKIAPLTLVLNGKEGLNLPELSVQDIFVSLDARARALYTQMENDMIMALESDTIIAANAAVATSKCRQVANGGIYGNAKDGTWEDVHDAKVEALEDLIEELSGESLLVVYEFGFDLDKLQRRFKTLRRLTTGNPTRDATEIQGFSNGTTRLGAGQFSSISLGIDGLQNSCHHIAMFGIPWDLQSYIQVIDRVHRSGQKFDVTIHRILARDTVDERVLKVLGDKDATQEGFLKLLKSMRAT